MKRFVSTCDCVRERDWERNEVKIWIREIHIMIWHLKDNRQYKILKSYFFCSNNKNRDIIEVKQKYFIFCTYVLI